MLSENMLSVSQQRLFQSKERPYKKCTPSAFSAIQYI